MRSIFLRVVGAALACVLVLLLIGLLLPRRYDVQTEVVIEAPPESVFPMINRLPNWRLWSSWSSEKNSGVEIQYGAVLEGEKATLSWREQRGNGRLWIHRSVLNESIEYTSIFANFPEMETSFRLVPEAEGKTRVIWRSFGKLPNGPFYGWAAMVFSTGLSAQYNRDLTNLKELCEKEFAELGKPPPPAQRSYDPGIAF